MPRVDPFVSIQQWRSSLYCGASLAISRFLDGIDTGLLPGWARDLEYERSRLRPVRLRFYTYDQKGDAAVRVCLQQVTPTRVRGGPVQVLRHSLTGDTGQIGRLVAELVSGCVMPAASVNGIRYTRPTFGPRSVCTPNTEMLFNRLADIADGSWPLDDQAKKAWDELVSGCLAEHVAIDGAELCRWFAESGWTPDTSKVLTDHFFKDSEWLAQQLAVLAP